MKEKKCFLEEVDGGYSSRVVINTDRGGYIENEVKVEFVKLEDGVAIRMEDPNATLGEYIYFYAEQISHLRTILNWYDRYVAMQDETR